MQTIFVSSSALFCSKYSETMEGLENLKKRQDEGTKIIILSKESKEQMKMMGGIVSKEGSLSAQINRYDCERTLGIKINFFNPFVAFNSLKLLYDYAILANGSEIINSQDQPLYRSELMPEETVKRLKSFLNSKGYLSSKKAEKFIYNKSENSFTKNGNNVYQMFSPSTKTEINSEVFAIQVNGKNPFYNDELKRQLEETHNDIICYESISILNLYQRKVNFLSALRTQILATGRGIDINDSIFILGDETEKCLIDEYPNSSYVVGKNMFSSVPCMDSLAKVLQKVKGK